MLGLPMGFLGAEKSAKDLIDDLRSEDIPQILAACYKLGEMQSKEAVPHLIPIIEKNDNEEVVYAAIMALGRIQEEGKSTEALLSLTRKTQNDVIRYAGLLSLANIQDGSKQQEFLELCNWVAKNTQDQLLKDLALRLSEMLKKGA